MFNRHAMRAFLRERIGRKGKVALSVALILLCAVVLCHRVLFSSGMEWYLRSKLALEGRVALSYERVGFGLGGFCLHHVAIKHSSPSGEQEIAVEIDQVEVVFDHLFKTPHLTLYHPRIAIASPLSSSKEINVFKAFWTSLPLRIEEGELRLGKDQQLAAFFELNFNGVKGEDFFKWKSKKSSSPPTLSIKRLRENREVTCAFDRFDLNHFFRVAHFFSKDLKEKIAVTQGLVDGELALSWSSADQLDTNLFDLKVCKLSCKLPKYGVKVTAKELKLAKSSKEVKDLFPLFGRFSPLLGGEGELCEVSISFFKPQSEREFATADILKGKIQVDDQGFPLLDVRGHLRAASSSTPFEMKTGVEIKTGGGLYGKDEWKVAIDFKADSQRYEAMGVYLSLSGCGSKRYFVEFDSRHLPFDYLQMIKHSLEKRWPQLSHFELTSGSLDLTLTGWIEEGALSRCEVRHFLARHFVAKWPTLGGKLSAAQIKGQGEFDLTEANFFEGGYWHLRADQGSVTIGETKVLDHISMQVAMHNRYVKPSHLTANLGDIEMSMQFEGLLSHLNIGIDIGMTPEDILVFGSREEVFPLDLAEKIAIRTDLQLRMINQTLSLDGVCDFLRVKGKNDRVEFGCEFNRANLKLETTTWAELKEMFCRGWFRTEKLSAQTANVALYFFGRKWYGKGELGAQGEWTSKAVELHIDPTDLIYCSDQLRAYYPPSLKGQALNCHFRYDVWEKRWEGSIPLRGIELEEGSLGLLFEGVMADLSLEGSELFSEQLLAHTDGISLIGKVVIDYAPLNYAELHLNLSHFEGQVRDVRAFLRHFDFEDEGKFPLKGRIVSGEQGMQLHAYFGAVNQLLKWDYCLKLEEGQCALSQSFECDQLEATVIYSMEKGRLTCQEIGGEVLLKGGHKAFACHLNIPLVAVDFNRGLGSYDFRLETPSYDLCRLKGELEWGEEGIDVRIDPNSSHSFGAVGEVSSLMFDWEGRLSHLDVEATLSALDLYQHLELLSFIGAFPVRAAWLEEWQSPRFEGELVLNCHYNSDKEELSFVAKAGELVFGSVQLDSLDVCGKRQGGRFTLEHCRIGDGALTAIMEKNERGWEIPHIDLQWEKHSILEVKGGKWDQLAKRLNLPLEKLELDPVTLAQAFALDHGNFLNTLLGTLSVQGVIDIDYSRGFKEGEINCELNVSSAQREQDSLCLKSKKPLHLTFSRAKGLVLKQGAFDLFHPDKSAIWASGFFERIAFSPQLNELRGEKVHVVIPPEIIAFLAKALPLSRIKIENDQLQLFDLPFDWHNQIEASFSFVKGKTLSMSGRLAEGYYWLGEHSWKLNDCFFSYTDEQAVFRLQTGYKEVSFEVGLSLSFFPELTAQITIWEISPEGPLRDPLNIETGWNCQEGFFIQTLSGKSCGLDFSFHHNPRESFLSQMVLTGQVKVDLPVFAKMLPEKFQHSIGALGVGKGCELSGDVTLPKEHLNRAHFIGYLKGKSFELFGSELETLLSKITIYPNHVLLTDFRLSDAAGICRIKHLRLEKLPDESWQFLMPKLLIQDFRPSLLKKIGTYRGRIKPLTIRKLDGYHLRGKLSDPKTWTGQGHCTFINTFKRDHYLFNIPFEIIGRLGLDMGLLIPVCGELDCCINDGKLSFTGLTNSYSNGKLSEFFLSPNRPSYIDFDGKVNINIRMKQYVLLKLTEPFTLSITGNLEHPRYKLN